MKTGHMSYIGRKQSTGFPGYALKTLIIDTRFKQSAFGKGGKNRLLLGFGRKRFDLRGALGRGHGAPPFAVCFRSMTRSSSNPWR